jgi:hypothetical protein
MWITQLTRETETGGDSGHDARYKMVEITVGGGGELEGAEADIIQGFVIDAEGLVRVLNELMDGECGVVGFNDGVGHLGRRYD